MPGGMFGLYACKYTKTTWCRRVCMNIRVAEVMGSVMRFMGRGAAMQAVPWDGVEGQTATKQLLGSAGLPCVIYYSAG